jgi:hypothetical protein
MLDPGYQAPPKRWNSQAKVLVSILTVHLPFFWWLNGYAWGMINTITATCVGQVFKCLLDLSNKI